IQRDVGKLWIDAASLCNPHLDRLVPCPDISWRQISGRNLSRFDLLDAFSMTRSLPDKARDHHPWITRRITEPKHEQGRVLKWQENSTRRVGMGIQVPNEQPGLT